MKLDCCLTPLTRVNSKCIKGSNVRCETIKLLEGNIEKMLIYISLADEFLDRIPKTQATKAKLNMWGHIKMKTK